MLLFGGNFGFGVTGRDYVYNDKVYAFDPQNPAAGFQIFSAMTMARGFPIAITDPLTGLVMVVGGLASTTTGTSIPPEIELFEPYTNQASIARSLPRALSFTAVARDPERQLDFIIGGRIATTPQVSSQIIVFDENADLYSSVALLADQLPFPRSHLGAAWDATSRKIVMFGGLDQSYVYTSQILEINPYANPGSQVTIAPETLQTPMVSSAVVADPSTNKIYLFGGQGPIGYVNSILEWDPSRQPGNRLRTLSTQLSSARAYSAATWHPQEQAVYIFGGTTDLGYSRDIIKFTPSTGQVQTLGDQLLVGTAAMSAVYDPAHQSFLFFGGDTQAGPSDKIYRYTQGNAPMEVGTFSTGRLGTSAVFSPERTTAYVFGGNRWGIYFTDIWAFSLGS